MVKPSIKCGNSNTTYNAAPAAKEDDAPRRVTTRMHILESAPVAAGFRVVARLRDGATALLVTADTRAEVLELAWKRSGEVPEGTVRLMLERWKGGERFGTWIASGVRRGELPEMDRPARRTRNREVW